MGIKGEEEEEIGSRSSFSPLSHKTDQIQIKKAHFFSPPLPYPAACDVLSGLLCLSLDRKRKWGFMGVVRRTV